MNTIWRLVAMVGLVGVTFGLMAIVVLSISPTYRDPNVYCLLGGGPILTPAEVAEHDIIVDSHAGGNISLWPWAVANCYLPTDSPPGVFTKPRALNSFNLLGLIPLHVGCLLLVVTGLRVALSRIPTSLNSALPSGRGDQQQH